MVDETLSDAVLTYVWGTRGRPWPSRDAEAVRERYQGLAAGLIPRIEAIFTLGDATDVDWSVDDLKSAVDRIELLISTVHPELRGDAVRAIGDQFSYCWK